MRLALTEIKTKEVAAYYPESHKGWVSVNGHKLVSPAQDGWSNDRYRLDLVEDAPGPEMPDETYLAQSILRKDLRKVLMLFGIGKTEILETIESEPDAEKRADLEIDWEDDPLFPIDHDLVEFILTKRKVNQKKFKAAWIAKVRGD